MSIRIKILLPLLAFLSLGAIVSIFIGAQSLRNQAELAALSEDVTLASDASREAHDQFDKVEQLTNQVMAMTDFMDSAKIASDFTSASVATSAHLSDLKKAAISKEMSDLAQEAIDDFAQWRSDAEVLMGLRPAGQIATQDVMARRGRVIRLVLNKAVSLAGRNAREVIATAGAKMRMEFCVVLGGASILAIAAIVGAFYLARNLARPLTELVANAQKLAAGDVSVKLTALDRRDEVGDIARAIEVFRGNVRAQMSSQADSVEQRRIASIAMGTIANGLTRLATGDLTCGLTAIPDTYLQLELDFNAALTQLRQAMQSIAQSSQSMKQGSGAAFEAAENLASRNERQAANLVETVATLDRVMATVRKTADDASHATALVSKAKLEAESSSDVVSDAIRAMGKIATWSDRIGQIVGVIDDIALQTNMLALNATVEAARAGDAGRGFAVVASEVRALAQRSAEAAKDIKTLISNSASQVKSGVSLVDRTGRALTRIVDQVGDVNGVVSNIAASASDQVLRLDEVNIALNQIGKITQQNAVQAEESTAASHQLAEEARQLAALIARFTIAELKAADRTGNLLPYAA